MGPQVLLSSPHITRSLGQQWIRIGPQTFVLNAKCWAAPAFGGGGWERTCLMPQTTRPGGQETVTNLRQGRGQRGLEKIQPWQEGERNTDTLICEGQPAGSLARFEGFLALERGLSWAEEGPPAAGIVLSGSRRPGPPCCGACAG